MPPRSLTLAIVAFWLATSGWFFYRDLWPRLHPEDRPPVTIDLAEEAKVPPMPAGWVIEFGGKRIGSATTVWEVFFNQQTVGEACNLVRADEDDGTYEIYQNFRFQKFKLKFFGVEFHPTRLESRQRVTASGEMIETDARVEFMIVAAFQQEVRVKAHVAGRVKDGRFAPVVKLESDLLSFTQQLEPIEVRAHHSIFDPTRPWNRLYDVQEDRTWRIMCYDPLHDSLMNSLSKLAPGVAGEAQVTYLDAGVLSEIDERNWDRRDVKCQVIEYRGENIGGETGGRKSDGLVIRQEAIRNNNPFAMERKPR